MLSVACVPSRASLFTGLSPWQHNVGFTDGLAKLGDDPKMAWLDPSSRRTLGHRFRAAGYETAYVGKWHLSHHPEARGGLEPFGFGGWRGPDPHGANPANSGLQRDATYVAEAEAALHLKTSAPLPALVAGRSLPPRCVPRQPARHCALAVVDRPPARCPLRLRLGGHCRL